MEETKGFFGALFDFTFTDFITSKMIRLLYIILIIAAGIGTIVFIIGAFNASAALGALTLLILGPIGFIIAVICIRIYMEIIIVLFRIAENTTLISKHTTVIEKHYASEAPPEKS